MISGDGGFDEGCTSGAGGIGFLVGGEERIEYPPACLLYTSDAADE